VSRTFSPKGQGGLAARPFQRPLRGPNHQGESE
jgi:hypothetical protein